MYSKINKIMPASIRATENEFRSQVVSWLNQFFKQGGYPFELATGDPSISDREGRGFPDVQLWLNRQAKQGFCGWELKPPSIKADDDALIKNAIEKAERMNARYFVTWNMRDAIIWEKSTDKVQRLLQYPPLAQITSVEDLSNPSYRIILEERAREILNDLTRLFQDGHLTYIGADDWFFIHRITEASHKLQPFFKQRLLEMAAENSDFRQEINEWGRKQGFYIADLQAFYETVSLQIVYQLLGRLLFYEISRVSFSNLKPIELRNFPEKDANFEIKQRFADIRAIDYQAIFEEDLPDKVLIPQTALSALADLLDDLNRRDFAHLPQEVLGSIFENLIPSQERHRLGQYFTNENLVDFITAFCLRKADDFVLDPTCGSGTFLMRAYNRLKWQFGKREHQKLLSQIWGCDIAPFPAELATINLYRQDLSNVVNFPRILKKDFFSLSTGQEYEFPPNQPFAGEPTRKIKEPLPLFDSIVGNPPYIRQEDIDKVSQGYTQKIIKPAFDRDIGFLTQGRTIDEIGRTIDEVEKNQPKFSGQADIYASMFVHAAALLKEGGRLGFVTSNSWLGAGYGKELQKFFLQYFKIIAICESRVEPWFKTAQVNTIFTILERCSDKTVRENNLVKFVSVKKKLSDLMPWDMQTEAVNRWHNLNILVNKIEQTGGDFIKFNPSGEMTIEPPKLVNDFEDEHFRISVIKQGALNKEIVQQFGEGQWGRFLRGPKVYFELRETLANKLASLNNESIAENYRGITTGITDFFIVNAERIKEFGIEKEFLQPFLTTFRDISKLVIDSKSAKDKLFICHLDKKELRQLGKKGALQYIEWGEQQRTTGKGAVGRGGVLYPEVPSVKNRALWYDVGEHEMGDVVLNRFMGERLGFPVNQEKILIGDSFFEIKFLDEKLKELWAALMNSSLVYLFAEIAGRTEAGGGVLRLYGPEIKTLYLPDARKISKEYQKKILKAFETILQRPIKKISGEVKEKDRRKFDSLVLQALGLEPEKYLDEIYSSLVNLVQTRVALGKMQTIEQKKKQKSDTEKVKEETLKEVLPDGLRPFPEAFLTASKSQYKEVVVPTGKLKLGNYLLGTQEVVNERGEKYQAKTVWEAEFIVFAQKPDSHITRLPKQENVLQNAVKKYKKYLKETRERLIRILVMRTGDERLSERLASEVLEELGVLFWIRS